MEESLLLPLIEEADYYNSWNLAWIKQHPQYEERPVDVVTFIEHPYYMDAKDECWDSVKSDLKDLFINYDDPFMNWFYNEAVFDEGIGGGKSYKSSVIITYLAYRTLILKDPHKFLHLARGSGIYFMNMSIRGDQARKVVFGEINQRIQHSPWFRKKEYLPNPNVKSELQLPKSINIVPGNSKETFPLGFNLLGAVMDEAAWYTETETHDVAEEMYNALHNRIKNRFGYRGMLVMISSPRYVDDFTEKKMAEAQKPNSRIFSRRRTSWEAQPKDRFCGKTFAFGGFDIPIEYEKEVNRNFERFKRDIMAIPSLALEPYFRQWEMVEAGVDSTIPYPLVNDIVISTSFKGNPTLNYFMHIDLSLTTDATGIAMCHMEDGIIKIDLMMRIKAPKGREIDLAAIRGIVIGLRAKGFSINKVTYDQFQSASSIQELNKMGLNAERLSVDKDLACYETLKEGIYSSRIKYYLYEPFMNEMQRLELVNGKKVDHPTNGSKDVADAVAGAVYNCVTNQNNFQFWLAGQGKKAKTEKEIIEESKILTADGLVPYGYFRGRRSY